MTIHQARIISLPHQQDSRGALSFAEGGQHIPFTIARVYYLYHLTFGENRGGHAHKALQQLIIAVSGSFTVQLDDGRQKVAFTLNHPAQGLYVPAGLWRDLKDFSQGAACLVLASLPYSEDDYYRDYQEYLQATQGSE